MAPYFCYFHNGLYVSSPTHEGCQDVQCIQFAKKEVRPQGVHMARFGGSTATRISRHNSDTFHKDMYAYKDAVDQGTNPDQVTATAAETALKQAEAVA